MNFQDLSDQQVLDAVGHLGPGMVGRYLFERAEWIRARDAEGRLGPAMLDGHDGAYHPSEAACEDLTARGMLVEVTVPIEVDTPLKRGPGRPKKAA